MLTDFEEVERALDRLPEYKQVGGVRPEISYPLLREVDGEMFLVYMVYYSYGPKPDYIFIYDLAHKFAKAFSVEEAMEYLRIPEFPVTARPDDYYEKERLLEDLFWGTIETGKINFRSYRLYISTIIHSQPEDRSGYYMAFLDEEEEDYRFKALPAEEAAGKYPMIEGKRVLGYALEKETGERDIVGVFLPSLFDARQAVLYDLAIDDSLMSHWKAVKDFFDGCFEALRKEGFRSVYYRSTGSDAELVDRYDLLMGAGFEPLVLVGNMVNYKLSELLETKFAKDKPSVAVSELKVTPLTEKMSPKERMYVNTIAANDVYLRRAVYTPEHSYVCWDNDDKAGILCMSRVENLLTMTALYVSAEDKKMHKTVLLALLKAMLDGAKDLPADTRVRLFYEDRYELFEAQRAFHGSGTPARFQEFTYTL